MTEIELCSCLRPRADVHCPLCGSYDRYALAKAVTTTVINNVDTIVRSYRCRKCGGKYNDIDRLQCAAPEVVTKEKRIASKVNEEVANLTYDQRKAWARKQLAKLSGKLIPDETEHVNAFERELEEKTGEKK